MRPFLVEIRRFACVHRDTASPRAACRIFWEIPPIRPRSAVSTKEPQGTQRKDILSASLHTTHPCRRLVRSWSKATRKTFRKRHTTDFSVQRLPEVIHGASTPSAITKGVRSPKYNRGIATSTASDAPPYDNERRNGGHARVELSGLTARTPRVLYQQNKLCTRMTDEDSTRPALFAPRQHERERGPPATCQPSQEEDTYMSRGLHGAILLRTLAHPRKA